MRCVYVHLSFVFMFVGFFRCLRLPWNITWIFATAKNECELNTRFHFGRQYICSHIKCMIFSLSFSFSIRSFSRWLISTIYATVTVGWAAAHSFFISSSFCSRGVSAFGCRCFFSLPACILRFRVRVRLSIFFQFARLVCHFTFAAYLHLRSFCMWNVNQPILTLVRISHVAFKF